AEFLHAQVQSAFPDAFNPLGGFSRGRLGNKSRWDDEGKRENTAENAEQFLHLRTHFLRNVTTTIYCYSLYRQRHCWLSRWFCRLADGHAWLEWHSTCANTVQVFVVAQEELSIADRKRRVRTTLVVIDHVMR